VTWQTVTVLLDATAYGVAALIAIATALAVTVTLRIFSRRSPRPAAHPVFDDYGLLRTLVLVDTLDTGLSVRALLGAGGVRATVSTGTDGLVHVLVFPDEYNRARRMVSWVL
jgi:hypothetical protein